MGEVRLREARNFEARGISPGAPGAPPRAFSREQLTVAAGSTVTITDACLFTSIIAIPSGATVEYQSYIDGDWVVMRALVGAVSRDVLDMIAVDDSRFRFVETQESETFRLMLSIAEGDFGFTPVYEYSLAAGTSLTITEDGFYCRFGVNNIRLETQYQTSTGFTTWAPANTMDVIIVVKKDHARLRNSSSSTAFPALLAAISI